VQLSVG